MIRPLFVIWTGVVSGELLCIAYQKWGMTLAIAAIFFLIFMGLLFRKYLTYFICLLLSIIAGFFLLYFASHCNLMEFSIKQDAKGNLAARVLQIKQGRAEDKITLVVQRGCFRGKNGSYELSKKVIVYLSEQSQDASLLPGDVIDIEGEISFPKPPGNPGEFHQENYLRSQGIYYIFWGNKIRILRRPFFNIRRKLYKLRENMADVYRSLFPDEQAGLLQAMVLGDKSDLSEDLKNLYEENGVAHLLAVSGLHVSIVGGRVYRFFRKKKQSYLKSCFFSCLVLLLYGIMTGFGSSVLRACLMFFVYLGAEYFGADYDMISSMGLAGVLMLAEHPYRVLEGGFIISFTSILAIGIVLPLIQDMIHKWDQERKEEGKIVHSKIYVFIRNQLIQSLAIYAVTSPVTMFLFYENTPYSVLLNPLILPWMTLLMLSAMAATFFGMLAGQCQNCFLWGSLIGGLPAYLILTIYKSLFLFFRQLPGALWISGCPSLWKVLGIYMVEAAVLYLLWKRQWKKACMLILLTAGIALSLAGLENKGKIVLLDVGQGDCILIVSPEGHTALIDGGSSSMQQIFQYQMKPVLSYYGIAHLDYVLLTHSDSDHISGIQEMLQAHFPVDTLLTADVKQQEDEKLSSLLNAAKRNHTNINYIKKGETIHLGSMSLHCLYPDENCKVEDKNDESIILYMQCQGVSALFTGDLSSEHEEEVMQAGVKYGKIDLLKVGHHGSKYSTSKELLECFSPKEAMISAGEKNRYGHPHKETLDRLVQADCHIYRTDEGGAIMVSLKKQGYHIQSYHNIE